MTGSQGYAQRHLEHNDYYDRDRTVRGEWYGRGAELLGLRGEVKANDFESIREGLHPETGEFLRPRHSADRISSNGATESKARSLYDLTYSAPKSVSVQAYVGGDDRLVAAHRIAVREALEETERIAGARVRLAGANHDRQTGNLVIAAYTHDSSRQLDPQLHTHAVSANLTYDGIEGRWKALQASGIYERRAYLSEVYRNALAREVKTLGYEIENQRNTRGVDTGFEIKGVPRELLERYSQRSAQRDTAIREFRERHGRSPTDNEVAVLVRETRPDKLQEISREEVRQIQLIRISLEERAGLQELERQSHAREFGVRRKELSPVLEQSKDHLFERRTVVKEHELFTEVLRNGRGDIDLSELRGTHRLEAARGDTLQVGEHLTTSHSLGRERSMVATINEGLQRYLPFARSDKFETKSSLRREQREAVTRILGSRDFAVNLRGAAGTGKTATLQEIERGLRESGHEVFAVSPTRSAVEELQKVGFSNAVTIAHLQEDETSQQQLRRAVLIVDEAGMVSGRQMEGILSIAKREDARIIFSGDTRQIQSVESSDALRILERESRMMSVSLTGIQRQSDPAYREAIQTFRHSPQDGYTQLESLGAIREVSFFHRADTVAEVYREMTSAGGRSVLVVAPTHEEIARITYAIRADLIERKVIGESRKFERHNPLQWTEAQKRDIQNYRTGHVLTFVRSSRGFDKHASYQVKGVREGLIEVVDIEGATKEVRLSQSRSFSVHEKMEIDVAPGDRLLLMGNRRSPEFRATNGETVDVRAITAKGIELSDGRTIPSTYGEFTHGYAVTAHRSQGKTVDKVIISADSMSQELFYVAASRGREAISIITSDSEQLAHSIGVSMARPSAIELSHKVPNVPELALGKDLARSVASPNQEISHVLGFGLGM